MRVFIFLTFFSFLMVPVAASAGITCNAKRPPRITVTPSKSEIKYDFTKSKADLNRHDVDTISPYGHGHAANVSGLMSGSIQLKNKVGFMHETYKFQGRSCVFLRDVEVEIHVEPTIYIAREFPQGTCMHNTILKHEFKHVNKDQLIINKYVNLIGKRLEAAIDGQGSTYGPIRTSLMNDVQQDAARKIQQVVIDINEDMNKERRKRQQAIDTLEEYESIGQSCKQ